MYIHNNVGAMTALHMLGGTTRSRETAFNEVATGKSIGSASDNAAIWAISQIMEADVSGFSALSDTLSLSEATVSVASVGAERATEILGEMKQLAVLGTGQNVNHAIIEEQMAHKTSQLNSIINSSQFNGVNLLRTDIDGTGATAMTVASSLDRPGGGGSPVLSNITVNSLDLEGSPSFNINGRTAITDSASAATALTEIEGFMQYAIDGAAALGASASRIADQNQFIGKLADVTRMSISKMTDANMEEAITRMMAMEVQHKLGIISLNIANSMPETLLKL